MRIYSHPPLIVALAPFSWSLYNTQVNSLGGCMTESIQLEIIMPKHATLYHAEHKQGKVYPELEITGAFSPCSSLTFVNTRG